ncbi:hypothetical protein OEZ86_014684 [Tetradesmus obliquus]|nr:hypothetical protein OEZ86_014684 [Tetradesmus obliquus]WIA37825.1 hypothetical protein OEZ86_014684 [Tetradesmus obliquus]
MARRQLRSTNCANRSLGHVHIRQPHFSIAAAAARQQQHRPAVLSQAVNGQIDINEIYTSSDSISNPYVGPVKAVRLKVGLGLESSRSLQAGETLLLSTPLALISHSAEELAGASPPTAAAAAASSQGVIPGEDDAGDDAEDDGAADDESGYDEGGQQYEATDTDIDQLAEQLAGSSSAHTRAWLQFLDDGSLEPSRTSQLPDLLAMAALSSSSSSSSEEASPAAAAAAAPDSSSSSSRQIDDNTLLDITDLNVQVLVEDDALLGLNAAAAAAAAGGSSVDDGLAAGFEEPKTLVGIWPELNLLQHSCSPNTSVVAHKSAAIVTASRGVAKQAALSRNLLGANLLAPLGERRAALQEMTGSKCMCLRCRDEERTDRNFQQLMAEIHEACIQQVGPDLEQAVEVDDEAAMEGLRDQLAAFSAVAAAVIHVAP